MKKALFFLLVLLSGISFGQVPQGYYNGTSGLTGTALLDKLKQIISNGHQTLSYSDLYTYYESTDRLPNTNKVWDMYSMDGNGNAAYYYYFGQGQECGTYHQEGDCYNREHSLPQSWFNKAYPMKADLFIVYPTDGYVNNRRSSYIYGEVASASWTSSNGSKLGNMDLTNNPDAPNVTCFEPIDAYKGDFARTYFYVATRYKDNIPNWDFSTNLQYVFNSDGSLKSWAVKMFLRWHHQDPVSQKEIARNDSVYKIQGNRNPFIDHPEFADSIWAANNSGGNGGGGNSSGNVDTLVYNDFSNCTLTGWTLYAPSGSNGWNCSSSNGYIYANAYNATAASDDWIITPQINPQGYSSVKLNFDSYTKYSDNGITHPAMRVYYSTDYNGSGDPTSATWTEITGWTIPAENSTTWTNSGDLDLSSIGQSFYIGFHYISSGTSAGQAQLWYLDNILIKAENTTTGLTNIPRNQEIFSIFPNPTTNGQINIVLATNKKGNITAEIIGLDGKILGKKVYPSTLPGEHYLKLTVPHTHKGTVIIRLITPDNTFVRQIILQ